MPQVELLTREKLSGVSWAGRSQSKVKLGVEVTCGGPAHYLEWLRQENWKSGAILGYLLKPTWVWG